MIEKAAKWAKSMAIAANEASATDPHSVPGLMNWAKEFNVAGESWILEGALKTLALWQRNLKWHDFLDLHGFVASCVVNTLDEDKEAIFRFEHAGWDPQFERWLEFRKAVRAEFEKQLHAYEKRQR